MYSAQKKWFFFSLVNLMLVALLGVTLRYKIAFSLPFIDQQKLLHGHSHFAFTGWVTQALMTLLVGYLSDRAGRNYFLKYKWILIFNAVTAYGMLFSFPVQGYGSVSILFSTLSLFASYYFAFYYWRDLGRLPFHFVSDRWFKVALIGNVISSAGPFSLAYMMASQHMNQSWYLASIYFYLHFQYNIWFFFSCMGLLAYKLEQISIADYHLKSVFYGFTVAAVPTYLLSVLWSHIPVWLYVVALLGVSCQLYAWTLFLIYLYKYIKGLKRNLPVFSRLLFVLAGLAVTIKLLLQTFSVIPSVSKLAFGFRPIIIGYLHLILLGIISLFIIAYTYTYNILQKTKAVKSGISLFVFGILINELLLMSQGVSDLLYVAIPHINILLLLAAVMLLAGIIIIVSGQFISKDDLSHKKELGGHRNLKKITHGKYSSTIHCVACLAKSPDRTDPGKV
jgi:hypothetical protein